MLACAQLVSVHGQTHGTARLAPFKARLNEDFVQAFRFRLALHQARTRHHHSQLDGIGHFVALRHFCRFTQVFNTRVSTGADKDFIQLDIGDLLIRLQAHVLQRAGVAALNGFVIGSLRVGYLA